MELIIELTDIYEFEIQANKFEAWTNDAKYWFKRTNHTGFDYSGYAKGDPVKATLYGKELLRLSKMVDL